MKAIAIHPGQKESVHLREVAPLTLQPGEIMLRGIEVGICGTDLEIQHGMYGTAPAGQDYLVLGHEALGEVSELGSGMLQSDWQVGDLVVPTVRRPCVEEDPNCASGQTDMCVTGQYTERGIKECDGFLVEYYTEAPEFLVKVPPAFRAWGVLLEPTSVVEKAIEQAYTIQQRLAWQPRRAVVFGAGPLGLLATLILRQRGLEVWVVAQSLDSAQNKKAALVKRCGATYLSSQQIDISSLKQSLGQIDLIVEATGSSEVVFRGLTVLGTNGVMALTSLSLGQNALALDTNLLNMQIVMGNQVVVGSVSASRQNFEKGLERWGAIEREWPGIIGSLITRRLPLAAYHSAFTPQPDGIKTVVVF